MDEFKARLDYYLELVGKEEIFIAKDDDLIAKLLMVDKGVVIRSLRSILPPTVTVEEAHEEK